MIDRIGPFGARRAEHVCYDSKGVSCSALMLVLALVGAAPIGATAEPSPEPSGATTDGVEPSAEAGAEDEPPEPPAEPSDEGSDAPGDEGSTGEGSAGAGGPPAVGAGGGASGGALPSGQARSDDGPMGEELLDDGRRSRRRRARDRDEGHWQLVAPYPELGPIRYRDPESRRTLWLGADVTGTYLPPSLGLSDRATWVARPAGAWAFALTPWLAMGGRHGGAWLDHETTRLRVHEHQVELSGRPLAGSRPGVSLDDRLSVGVSTHAIQWTREDDGTTTEPGLRDTVVHVGYGLDHLLGTRWRLGWNAQGRYAWVHHDTQRQVRLSTRLAFNPRPAHRLSIDAVGYYVHRDDAPAGRPLPRHSVYGQVGLGYAWMGRAGVGPWTHVRATSGFRSGEAPVYELREDTVDGGYGEVLVGMMARWP